jgi:thiamine pyrophosphokinase
MKIRTHDQLDTEICRRLVRLHEAEKIVVIGNRHSRHAELCHAIQGGSNTKQPIN